MTFEKLSQKSKKLLDEILHSDNPANFLIEKFTGISHKEDEELRSIIKELRIKGYINVWWADNVPYRVIINNSARTYNEQLEEYEQGKLKKQVVYVTDQSINIGNGNTINDSIIASKISKSNFDGTSDEKKSFVDKHPILISIGISVVAGFILMFSFWDKIVNYIEGFL